MGSSNGKESACNAERRGFDPWVRSLGRESPGEAHGNPLQYSCLENYTGTVHEVAESDATFTSTLTFHYRKGRFSFLSYPVFIRHWHSACLHIVPKGPPQSRFLKALGRQVTASSPASQLGCAAPRHVKPQGPRKLAGPGAFPLHPPPPTPFQHYGLNG